MARFRLKAGYDEQQLGKLILQMAEAAGPNDGKIDEKSKADFERQLGDMIDPAFAGKLEVVYDTPDTVHVIIPFLGKRVYSDNNFANESMGDIAVRGCGR